MSTLQTFAERMQSEFPIFWHESNPRLVYLDNAATTQRPEVVIEAEAEFYRNFNANIHRAPHRLAEKATLAYEHVRQQAATYVGANDAKEICLTSGVTHAINLVALGFGNAHIHAGDEIVATELDHHSNIVPWQLLANRTGAKLKFGRINQQGELDLESFKQCLTPATKLVAFCHINNALGTINPVKEMVQLVRNHAPNAVVLVDGAQAVSHGPVNVHDLGCDFYAFSGHKMYAPTGTGVLWGRYEHLLQMDPVFGGGDMIKTVSLSDTTYADPPARFEAGTPNIGGVIGLGAAFTFASQLDQTEVERQAAQQTAALRQGLDSIPRVRRLSQAAHSSPIVSFVVEGMSPLDVAVRLNGYGVAVRTGHHCCMPLMCALGVEGTVRASCSIYNGQADLDAFLNAMELIVKVQKPASGGQSAEQLKPATMEDRKPISGQIKDLKEDLSVLDNAEDRYEMILEMGAKHPRRLESLRKVTPRVAGCMSDVRLVITQQESGEVVIESDSDSEFVRGLLGLVETVFSGRNRAELKAFAPSRLPDALGLVEFVSLGRRTGLEAVLRQIELAIQ